MEQTKDRKGATVCVGTRVRVVDLDAKVLANVDAEEAARVRLMRGEVFSVYEIDDWGSAWVEKWWHQSEGRSLSHSLALSPAEMEVVSDDDA